MRRLVLATRNPAKIAELRRLLAPFPWRLTTLDEVGVREELAETGATYGENALAKAAATTAITGLTALADDSGIEVVALRGWPGPRSARWLGPGATDEDRLEGLLAEVGRRCPTDRRARYVAAVALTRPGGEPVVAHGRCAGTLVEPRGANGFGYDPAFLSAELGMTLGEAGDAQKDGVSHRARALARLARSSLLAGPAASDFPP